MRTRGAVVTKAPGSYECVDLDVDDPRQGELLVRMAASGLCHTDDHIATGDIPMGTYPVAGGHEGAGVVEAVGPNTPGWSVGDHVVLSMLPSCGRCHWCATGMQNLCDLGANTLNGARFDDPGSFRLHTTDGVPVGQMCGISTFVEHSLVSVQSAVKISPDLPLELVCLLGCAVGTGWGAAVNSAQVRPGDTVVVMGTGGIGINAIQGAAHAGARCVIAVDPVAFKRDSALTMGATHAVAEIDEAAEIARGFTNGQGADSAIVTVGITTGAHVGAAFAAVRKAGTVVVVGAGYATEVGLAVPIVELSMMQKRIQGSLYGGCNPNADIPRLASLYRQGQLKLDELVTTRYSLDQVAKGYEDMHAGRNIRGVVVFD